VNERKIATFLTTAHAGSMSAAAARLGCTQSAVTQTVSGLEAELGCKLFERGPSGAALTENGRVLLPTAVQAHALLRRLREEAAAVSSGQEPPVRVGCFSSIACTWLPGAIAAWRRRNPQARFEVRVGTDELAGWLRAGQVDLALGDVERLREFAWEPLAEDRYLAVVPARYLDEHPGLGAGGYLTREELFGLPSALEPFNAAERLEDVERPAYPVRVACDDDSTLVALVARGLGVAAIPELGLRDVHPDVRVFELRPTLTRTLAAALSPGAREGARTFATFAREQLARRC
jgi:DNA-binding transcriptional LysR family regulator